MFCFFPPSIFVCLQFSVIKEGELLSTTIPEKQTDIYMSSELFFHKTERKMCDTNVIFRKQHSLFYLSHTIDSFILGLIWLTSSGPLLKHSVTQLLPILTLHRIIMSMSLREKRRSYWVAFMLGKGKKGITNSLVCVTCCHTHADLLSEVLTHFPNLRFLLIPKPGGMH